MRGILIRPGGVPEICRLPDTEQRLAGLLGGPLRATPLGTHFAAVLYTDACGRDLPCRHYLDRWYYGNILLVGWRNNNMTALSAADAETLAAKWASVEVQK